MGFFLNRFVPKASLEEATTGLVAEILNHGDRLKQIKYNKRSYESSDSNISTTISYKVTGFNAQVQPLVNMEENYSTDIAFSRGKDEIPASKRHNFTDATRARKTGRAVAEDIDVAKTEIKKAYNQAAGYLDQFNQCMKNSDFDGARTAIDAYINIKAPGTEFFLDISANPDSLYKTVEHLGQIYDEFGKKGFNVASDAARELKNKLAAFRSAKGTTEYDGKIALDTLVKSIVPHEYK
jgi:hypothetical protein